MFTKLLLAAFLVAHAAIHTSFIAPRPPATAGGPAWPFDLSHSWALRPLGLRSPATRALGLALVATTLAGFGLSAMSTLGILPAALWPTSVVVGSVASLGLLVLFFKPWLVLGLGVDLVLLWAALVAGSLPDTLP
jgi:hypothetical protein